jgi:type II secretory pathway pseudopilin PulG
MTRCFKKTKNVLNQSEKGKMKLKIKRRTSGMTLLEFGIVIGLFALVVGLALYVVPSIMANIRSNAEATLLPTVSSKIQRAYANQPNYSAVTTQQIAGLYIYPESEVSGNTITNRWGGPVTLAPATLVTANDAVAITSANVPTSECIQLEQAVESSFRTITINGSPVKTDSPTAVVNESTVSTACGNATNSMVFTFGK